MPLAWMNRNSVRLTAKEGAKLECAWERRRRMKNSRMRDDPQEPAQYQIGDPKCLLTGDDSFDPITKAGMISGVFAVSEDQHVHVG